MLTMIGATITNILIGEYGLMVQTIVLAVLAGFVAWARAGQYAVQPRAAATA